ncbi:MAG: septum site-determining protein MinC [Defluviitaleaceae bacterium]|nr:septum site-determining protein MinC [Defluviitaleaceae bacterium]
MNRDNAVIFKGGKHGIIIVIDKSADFVTIKKVLTAKIRDAYNFFGDAKTAITFKGRELSAVQLDELIGIITTETDLSISFIQDDSGEQGMVIKPDSKELPSPKPPLRLGNRVIDPQNEGTKLSRGNLRNGMSIEHEGSVFLIGDVHAGAEIRATGNVIVFGAIKGKVHAGCEGDASCIIAALTMQAIQLRIADKITYIDPKMIKANNNKIDPSYVYIEGEEVHISTMD